MYTNRSCSGLTYLLPVVIPRRLRAEISRIVDVLEFPEDVNTR